MLGLSFVHLFERVLSDTLLRGFLLLVVRIDFLLGGSLPLRLPGCHGSAGTPLGMHAGGEALGLEDARTAIRT
jgi:hypothetical protein